MICIHCCAGAKWCIFTAEFCCWVHGSQSDVWRLSSSWS